MNDEKKPEDQKAPEPGVRVEEFDLNAGEVVAKAKELFREGNIRRIAILDSEGTTLLEIPLSVGVAGLVAGAMMAPVLAAVGALAAVATKLKIRVERVDPEASK